MAYEMAVNSWVTVCSWYSVAGGRKAHGQLKSSAE